MSAALRQILERRGGGIARPARRGCACLAAGACPRRVRPVTLLLPWHRLGRATAYSEFPGDRKDHRANGERPPSIPGVHLVEQVRGRTLAACGRVHDEELAFSLPPRPLRDPIECHTKP